MNWKTWCFLLWPRWNKHQVVTFYAMETRHITKWMEVGTLRHKIIHVHTEDNDVTNVSVSCYVWMVWGWFIGFPVIPTGNQSQWGGIIKNFKLLFFVYLLPSVRGQQLCGVWLHISNIFEIEYNWSRNIGAYIPVVMKWRHSPKRYIAWTEKSIKNINVSLQCNEQQRICFRRLKFENTCGRDY